MDPFQRCALIDLMDFSLDNALLRMPDGTLRKQSKGVPMGDAISPGATIIALAYMEHMFLSALSSIERKQFVGIRYMDDLLTIYKENRHAPIGDTLKRIRQSMYQGELKLEPAHDSQFLETRFEVSDDGHLLLRLKNTNEGTVIPKVWRYQHWHSATSYTLKRNILLAALKKVHHMASDKEQLAISARAKIHEFQRAGYPFGVIKFMCNSLAATTGQHIWRTVFTQTTHFSTTSPTIYPCCGTVTRPVSYPFGKTYES